MKKILISIVVIAALIFGGLKFYTSKIGSKFYSSLDAVRSVDGIRIENEKFNGELFASSGTFDLVIKKDKINNYLALTQEDGLDEDLVLKVSANISHGVSNLLNGIETVGDVEMGSESLKKISNEIFNTAKPIKFKVLEKTSGEKDARFELAKIDKEVDGVKLQVADTFMDIKFDGSYKILENQISNDLIKIVDPSFDAKVEKLSYNSKYEKPLDISSMVNYNLVNASAKTDIKKISFGVLDNAFEINELASDTRLVVQGETISQIDKSKIGSFKYAGGELKEILIDTKVENIDKKALEDIINSQTKDSEIYFKEIEAAAKKIMQKGPKIVFEKLNFKNSDNKNYMSNLEISLDPSNVEGEFFEPFYLMRILNFKGDISMDTTPGEFFFKNLKEQKDMADQALLDSGVFVKTGDNYESKFNYNKRTQDIIFNNKISLKTFLATMF